MSTKKQEFEKYMQWRRSMTAEEKGKINAWLKENNQKAQFVGTGTMSTFVGVSQQSIRNWISDPEYAIFNVQPVPFTNGTFEGEFIDIYWFRTMRNSPPRKPKKESEAEIEKARLEKEIYDKAYADAQAKFAEEFSTSRNILPHNLPAFDKPLDPEA